MILTRSSASKAKELAEVRAKATAQVNQIIGQVRLKFITEIPGQQTIYAEKEREAVSYISTNPDPTFPGPVSQTAYPFIFQECQSVGYSPWEACQLFLNMAAQWRPIGAQLEGLRVGYNNLVAIEPTAAGIDQHLSDLTAILETHYGA